MVIDPGNISSTANANAKGKLVGGERAPAKGKPTPETHQPPSSVNVSLSPEAQSMGKLESAVSSAPDVDPQKVEAARFAIQSGQYSIDADAIAEKMLQDEV